MEIMNDSCWLGANDAAIKVRVISILLDPRSRSDTRSASLTAAIELRSTSGKSATRNCTDTLSIERPEIFSTRPLIRSVPFALGTTGVNWSNTISIAEPAGMALATGVTPTSAARAIKSASTSRGDLLVFRLDTYRLAVLQLYSLDSAQPGNAGARELHSTAPKPLLQLHDPHH